MKIVRTDQLAIMIEFLDIAPTPHLDLVKERKTHLLLAHLVEEDPDYREFYATLKEEEYVTYILHNSACEIYHCLLV